MATTSVRRVGIPTPREFSLPAFQQAINNIRERITGVEAIADALKTQSAAATTDTQVAYLTAQIASLQEQINNIDAGDNAVTALLADPNGFIVLRDGALLTRVLVPGAGITITYPDAHDGNPVIAATATASGFAPLSTGEEPLALVSDGQGQCVMVAYP